MSQVVDNNSKDIIKYFDQSKDVDYDQRFMAAQALHQILHDYNKEVADDTQQKIISQFIHQLDDLSKEVKSHAVRCLGQSLSKINEETIKKALQKVFHNFKTQEDIDIYATCLKTIISQIDVSFGLCLLTNTLPEQISFVMERKPNNAQTLENAIDIVNLIANRFSYVIKREKQFLDRVCDQHLVTRLMDLTMDKKVVIQQRSAKCLGTFAFFYSKEALIRISISLFEGIQSKNFTDKLQKFQTMSIIVKKAAGKLNEKIPQFTSDIVSEIIEFSNEDFIENYSVEQLSNYLEYLFLILETFMRDSKSVFLDSISHPKVIQKYVKCITLGLNYNPNTPGFLDEDDEDAMDEEDFGCDDADYDNEDSSWKVRKAAIELQDANQHDVKRPVCSTALKESIPTLLKLILFKDDNVNKELFQTLRELVQVIRAENGINVEETLSAIVHNICKFYTKTDSNMIKNTSIEVLNKIVTVHSDFAVKVWDVINSTLCSQLDQGNDECTGVNLDCQRLSVNSINPSAFKASFNKIFTIGIKKITDDLKQAFDQLEACLVVYGNNRNIIKLEEKNIHTLLDTLLGKIERSGERMKIKENSIRVLGAVLANLRDLLTTQENTRIFTQINYSLEQEALQMESFKALEGLKNGNLPLNINQSVSDVVHVMVQILLKLFVSKGRHFKIAILKVLEAMGHTNNLQISDKMGYDSLISNILTVVTDEDQFMCRLALNQVKLIGLDKLSKDTLQKNLKVSLNKLVEASNLEQNLMGVVVSCYELLFASLGESLISELMQEFSSKSNLDVDQVSLVLSSLILKSKNKANIVDQIIKDIQKMQKNTGMYLQVLGKVGTETDFSSKTELIKTICGWMNKKTEPLRSSAVNCIVAMSVANPKVFLSMQNFSNSDQDLEAKIFVYTSMKQLTLLKNIPSKIQSLNSLQDYLETHVDGMTEQLCETFSETVGRIMALNDEIIRSRCQKYMKKQTTAYKQLLCWASYYIFNKDVDITNYSDYLQYQITLTNDSDINVRTCAFQSQDFSYHYWPALSQNLNDEFYKNMAERMKFNKDLVQEDKLGAFTLKTDLGANTRKYCFSFLGKLINNDYFNANPFIEPVISQLDDTEETVRFCAFKILNHLAHKGMSGIVDKLELMLKKQADIYDKNQKKRDTIIREKGRQYQCMHMLIDLVVYAKEDKEQANNPEQGKLVDGITNDEEWSKIFEDCVVEGGSMNN